METTIKEKMKKLIYRLKATRTLYLASLMEKAGNNSGIERMYVISLWYHRQAMNMGYDGPAFFKDFSRVLLACGKKDEAHFFYSRAMQEELAAKMSAAA